MTVPRFRIAWLMTIVAIVAMDFGAVRAGLKVRRQLPLQPQEFSC